MSIKVRMQAAGLIARTKPLLLKEEFSSKSRLKKLAGMIKEAIAEDKKDLLNLLRHARSFATSYEEAIQEQLAAIKAVSILSDKTDAIKDFIAKLTDAGKRAGLYYRLYREKKQQFLALIKKTPVDWDEKLIGWIKKEKPTWEAVKNLLGTLADASLSITADVVKSVK
jgi:hypothetical protein